MTIRTEYILQTWYENGPITGAFDSFEAVRNRASKFL